MLKMSGSILPPMVNTRGLNEANIIKPKWSLEEEEQRKAVFVDLQSKGESQHKGLAKQIMVDKSAPVVSGKVSTPQGWVDVEKVVFAPPNPTNKQTKYWDAKQITPSTEKGVAGTKGPPGLAALLGAGPPGRGRGRGGTAAGPAKGLGDLFAGGMKPNPAALRGGTK